MTAVATWMGAEPTTAEWAWLRCPDLQLAGCTEIPGATADTYVPVAADTGNRLRVRLTVSDANGWAWQRAGRRLTVDVPGAATSASTRSSASAAGSRRRAATAAWSPGSRRVMSCPAA